MRVALLGWMGAVALVAACSGASNPLGGKSNAQGDGGGSGGSSGSSTSSGGGGSSSGSSSSGSSSGGATTCTNGSICNDGSAMQVCTTMGAGGKCASIRYTVDSTSFTCDGCSDCTSAQSQASQACAEAGSSSSSGGGSGGGSGSGSGSSSGSSSGGPVDAGDGDATCQAEVAASCVTCCQSLHATGVNKLVADIQACDCGANGACQTACASEYCADGTVSVTGDACDVCLQASVDPDGGACLSTLQTECAADADCLSYITCTNGCPAQ